MNLSLYKNEIIPVYVTDLGNKVVIARELYNYLGIKRQFADWVKDKVEAHGLILNQDYCLLHKNVKNSSDGFSPKSEKGGRPTKDYIFRLHAAKKIALGTNNEAGDRIKDYFIKCEEIVKRITTSESFDPGYYISPSNQKQLVKTVGGVLYSQNGECSDLIEHHQKNCLLHFGMKPSELREQLVRSGKRVKSKSAREIARKYKPEAACSMAVHDDFVAQGHTLEKLQEVGLRDKLEPAFKVVMDLGFTPKHLLR
jgi:phage anti-repressor protein